LHRALDDGFVDAQLAGCQVFEVQVGVFATGGERPSEIRFEIVFRDAKLLAKKGIGKAACV